MTKETIGFIGLGNLGLPIVTNLLDSGYPLRVYNRTASKGDALLARGAERATRPSDALATGGIVMTLLWDDASVESIVTSEDFLPRLGKDGVHVSMSTLSPAGSKALAALHTRYGSHFVEVAATRLPD